MSAVAARLHLTVRARLGSPWAMVVAALAVRLVVMSFTYTDQLNPARDHWLFGWETGRVARSIASGQGFSNPYPEPTGPTSLIPPAYAYLVAGAFRLFGTYTPAAALAVLTMNNVFSSLTCLPVFFIARRVFGVRTAVWAGWLWAFFPYSVALPNTRIWETPMTTLVFSLVILATLSLEDSSSLRAGLGYGALWGIAALTNPAVLSALPFLGAWVWLRHRRRGENCTGVAVAASLAFLVVVAPWIWRCSKVYGRFVAFRGGFGLEVLAGNSADTSTVENGQLLPGENPVELERVKRMGEPAYMDEVQREAWRTIARRPFRFVGLTLRRILNTWTCLWDVPPRLAFEETGLPNVLFYTFVSVLAFAGLWRAIRDHREDAVALVIPVIVFPLISYVSHSEMRYRHPIDPVLVVLIAYLAGSAADERKISNEILPTPSVRTSGAGFGCVRRAALQIETYLRNPRGWTQATNPPNILNE